MNLGDVRAYKKAQADTRECYEEASIGSEARASDDLHEIFSRYGTPILGFIYGLIGDRSRAEELTQETFIRAYCGLRSRREDTKLSTWLFGIAHNVVREAIKQKYRNLREVGLDEPESKLLRDLRQLPDHRIIARETCRTIQRAFSRLPEDHRIVFVLRVMYRLPYEEISTVTGASVGKLKTDLHRARAEMRRMLLPYMRGSTSGIRGES